MQTITGNSNLNVHVSRSLTRVWWCLHLIKSFSGVSSTTALRLSTNHVGSKALNYFCIPMFTEFDAHINNIVMMADSTFQIHIGSTLNPECRVRYNSEGYNIFWQCLGAKSNSVHEFGGNWLWIQIR